MKVALPYVPIDMGTNSGYKKFVRFSWSYPLVEVSGRECDWHIAMYVIELTYVELPHSKRFRNIDDAKKVLDDMLISKGYEIISQNRYEKLKLLI